MKRICSGAVRCNAYCEGAVAHDCPEIHRHRWHACPNGMCDRQVRCVPVRPRKRKRG
jgi:hypothetical protein